MSTALIILAEDFEELEAITVMDLFVRAGIEVTRAGLHPGLVRASRNTRIQPDVHLDELANQSFDIVVLPGGLPGADHLAADARVKALLQKQHQEDKWIAAICAAPRALIRAGVCEGKRITAYPGALEGFDLAGVALCSDAVVVDGKLVTSRGPGTAMDFALELIGVLEGEGVREKVEKGLAR